MDGPRAASGDRHREDDGVCVGQRAAGVDAVDDVRSRLRRLAVFFATRVVPRRVGIERGPVRRYAVAVMAFVVVYYVLWVASDALVASGVDAGWALRVVPNVLYYGVLVPFAYWRFFGRL
jgi:hypothetical protein